MQEEFNYLSSCFNCIKGPFPKNFDDVTSETKNGPIFKNIYGYSRMCAVMMII